MTVTIFFTNLPTVTMSYDEWEKWGGELAYKKANKIKDEITEIRYEPNQDNNSERKS